MAYKGRTLAFALMVAGALLVPHTAMYAQTYHEWRKGGEELRTQIDDLDEDIVEELSIPVLFGVARAAITPNFGERRGGGTRIHEGLDMMAPEGMPIVSPTDAVVVRTGDGSSSGLFVITANPGGESFTYMHLSKIADIDEGDVLERGDLIGFVGHTGNAIASAPHLHFEIHDDEDELVDPYPRTTKTIDLDDKMTYLEEIFEDMDDTKEIDVLAELIASRARNEVASALAEDIDVPDELAAAMKRLSAGISTPAPSVSTPPVVSGTPAAVGTTTLRVGSRAPAVAVLQRYLISKGATIGADGAFGPKTRQALIAYQKSVGLAADGVAGPKTLAYIRANP